MQSSNQGYSQHTHSSLLQWTFPLNISVSLGAPQREEIQNPRGLFLNKDPVAANIEGDSDNDLNLQLIDVLPVDETYGRVEFPLGVLESHAFSWENALALSISSLLAYESDATITKTAEDIWGCTGCDCIATENTHVFVASNDKYVIVAFRGVVSLNEWLLNANMRFTERPYGAVHQDTATAFDTIDAPLRALLRSHIGAEKRLFLTGHGSGGALATIASAEWRDIQKLSAYTFGQPAIGQKDFQQFVQGNYWNRIHRVVNFGDVVPLMLPGFRHVGTVCRFDRGGAQIPEVGTNVATVLSEREFAELRLALQQQVQSQRSQVIANESQDLAHIAHHDITNYVNLIRRQL